MARTASGLAVDGAKSHRVYLLLRDEIISGVYPPGSKLPGELRLVEHYGVSRVTVRRALAALEAAGMIRRSPGVGTVVLDQAVSTTRITADTSNLLPNIVRMGKDSEVRLLAFNYIPATGHIREQLGLPQAARVQRSVRLRLVDGKPFSHLTTHVPEGIAQSYTEADLASTPLHALLERSGVRVDSATQTISATLANQETAQALEVAEGAPLISVNRVVYDVDGKGVEHLMALYRPDRYRLQINLNRAGEEDSRYWEHVNVKPGGKQV